MAATSTSSFAARSRSTSSVVGTQRHAFPAWANRSASCTDRAWASYPSVPSGPKVASSWKNRSHTLVLSRSEEHTSELQSHSDLVCRLLLEKKKKHTHEQIRVINS